MDRVELLKQTKNDLNATSKGIREFISSILDESSFVETGTFAFSDNTTFDSANVKGEGVITGYGTIDGIPVYLYAQNYDVLKGGLGKAHADKIVRTLDAALKTKTAVLAIMDTAGARLGEGIEALEGYAQIMAKSVRLSGEVPQIGIVKGQALGCMSYIAALQDFTFMLEGSTMATSGPQVLAAKAGLTKSADEIIGAKVHAEKSGLSAMTVSSAELKGKLVSIIDLIGNLNIQIDMDTNPNALSAIGAESSAHDVINGVLDSGSFVELYSEYAKAVVCGLGKLGGITVGILANAKPRLCAKCAKKAARFVNFLNCYNIPLITFVDCEGAVVKLESEQAGVEKEIATLIYSIASASIAKISVITKKAVGVGYAALASKALGFDYSLAWAGSYVSALPAETGAEIVYEEEIAKADDPQAAREAVVAKYEAINGDPLHAAKNNLIDNIIDPAQTRPYLASALQMFASKEVCCHKEGGNYPL